MCVCVVQFLGCSSVVPDAVDKVTSWLGPPPSTSADLGMGCQDDHSSRASSVPQAADLVLGGHEDRYARAAPLPPQGGASEVSCGANEPVDTFRPAPGIHAAARGGGRAQREPLQKAGPVRTGGVQRSGPGAADVSSSESRRLTSEHLHENRGAASVDRGGTARPAGGGHAAAQLHGSRAAGKDISNQGHLTKHASTGVRAA